MKAFTERNPKRIGAVAVAVMLAVAGSVFFLHRSMFTGGYTVTARFPQAAGLGPGAKVTVAGVDVGTVSSVSLRGDAVTTTLSINNGVVLPRDTSAAIEVETVLGVLDVALQPISGWSHPLRNGARITRTSVPVELQNLQNTSGRVAEQADVQAFNQLLTAVSDVATGKESQVAQIIQGLDNFTGVIDARSSQVSQLIDAANTLSAAVASHDQQLSGVVSSLSQVVQGLAGRAGDLGSLIRNTDQLATQTAQLIGQNQPQLQQLLDHVHAVLQVVAAHQQDLAQVVAYLDSGITGFASIGYSGSTPNQWANIYTDLLGSSGLNELLGDCNSIISQVLDKTLGPDPLPCSQRTGPPVLSTVGTTSSPASSGPPSAAVTATPAAGGSGQGSPGIQSGLPGGLGSSSGGGGSNPLSLLFTGLLGG